MPLPRLALRRRRPLHAGAAERDQRCGTRAGAGDGTADARHRRRALDIHRGQPGTRAGAAGLPPRPARRLRHPGAGVADTLDAGGRELHRLRPPILPAPRHHRRLDPRGGRARHGGALRGHAHGLGLLDAQLHGPPRLGLQGRLVSPQSLGAALRSGRRRQPARVLDSGGCDHDARHDRAQAAARRGRARVVAARRRPRQPDPRRGPQRRRDPGGRGAARRHRAVGGHGCAQHRLPPLVSRSRAGTRRLSPGRPRLRRPAGRARAGPGTSAPTATPRAACRGRRRPRRAPCRSAQRGRRTRTRRARSRPR